MNNFRSAFITICICFYVSILCQLSYAEDILGLNQSIRDGQTLVASGEKFELGFFSPGMSHNRYLGIWYKSTPNIVVWVANRNTPLTDSEGVFTISSGCPILLDSKNNIIWTSNVSSDAADPVLQLLDTGNLVLKDRTSTNLSDFLWQSFNFPGSTRLPGMEMGQNLVTGEQRYLTSWRNADDPSPGNFTYKFMMNGLPMLLKFKGSRKCFRSGPWNGVEFNGFPSFEKPYQDSEVVYIKERLISISDPYNSSLLTRLTLNPEGNVEHFVLDSMKKKWNLVVALKRSLCDEYGKCGPNGVCNLNNSPSLCRCLDGFTPKHQHEWKLFDWSSGCVRIEPLNCGKGEDGFLNVSKVKLPDMLQFKLIKNVSLSRCKTKCLKNCSCTAYTNPCVNGDSCLMWFGDLFDISEYDNESAMNVYVRLPYSVLESTHGSGSGSIKHTKKMSLKVKLILAGVLILVASGFLFFGLYYWRIVLRKNRQREELRRNEGDLELPLYDFATVSAATRNFSDENFIGQGGFGPVYKGTLVTGQDIAVKRLSKDSGQGAEEFMNEVILIAKLQHRNLVSLLGCCIEGEERMLIYEYLQNKSLDHFIFDPLRSQLLTWSNRFDIIMGISRGLLYLHRDSRLKIIHRDLKTSNILLDGNLEPKISDFGLARIFGGDQDFLKTARVMGTYGYMAPEYAIDGKFSDKSDVFSMGVLILEIVSGKKNRYFSHPDHHHTLLGHAWLLWNENRDLELIDSCLMDSIVESQVKRCVQVGLLCVQNFAEDRPAMSSVVMYLLNNEEVLLPRPKQPGYFMERSSIIGASGREGWNSVNMLTITQLEPRYKVHQRGFSFFPHVV